MNIKALTLAALVTFGSFSAVPNEARADHGDAAAAAAIILGLGIAAAAIDRGRDRHYNNYYYVEPRHDYGYWCRQGLCGDRHYHHHHHHHHRRHRD